MTLGNGFDTPLLLSDELSEFLGAKMLCRTDVTRLMWTYIKENKLQSEKNGRTIICDEKLQKLFRRKTIDMFRMTKDLSKVIHLKKNAF